MLDVTIALLPTAVAAVWFFGASALMLIIVAVVSAVAAEFLYQKHTKTPVTVSDLSAVVTGLLLAFNLPANAPWWLAVVGSFLAIILVKQLFGGIGQNFINPGAGRTGNFDAVLDLADGGEHAAARRGVDVRTRSGRRVRRNAAHAWTRPGLRSGSSFPATYPV